MDNNLVRGQFSGYSCRNKDRPVLNLSFHSIIHKIQRLYIKACKDNQNFCACNIDLGWGLFEENLNFNRPDSVILKVTGSYRYCSLDILITK